MIGIIKDIPIISRNVEIKTIDDDEMFDINSVKMLYTLPVNSFTLVNDKENNIFLVKISGSKKKNFNQKKY